MAFDKEQYRKNRHKGLRGQGPIDKAVITPSDGKYKPKHAVFTPGKGAAMLNREQSRRKFIDHRYTRKGFRGHTVPNAIEVMRSRGRKATLTIGKDNVE